MAFKLVGPISQVAKVDAEGNREYTIQFKLETDDPRNDGPQQALDCPDLPTSGAPYQIRNDNDIWAWCRENTTATPMLTGEPSKNYIVEKVFSTKPPDADKSRCNTTKIEDPLMEPFKASGNFSKYTEEAAFNRFGRQLTYSSFEPIRGKPVEFDNNRPTVKIEQNIANLNWPLCAALVDCVNYYPMWGIPRRCVKLSNVSWERKYWGLCGLYYTRTLEFEVNWQTWDRNVVDESHLCLRGKWLSNGNYQLQLVNGALPNPNNPAHFDAFTDLKGNPKRGMLNGFGLPAGACVQYPASMGGGTFFTGFLICITNTPDAGDIGTSNWVRLAVDPRNVPVYNSSQFVTYAYGYMVKISIIIPGLVGPQLPSRYYLQRNPNGSRISPLQAGNLDWTDMGTDVEDLFQGPYSEVSGDLYRFGDSVYTTIEESAEVVGTGSQNAGFCFPTGFGSIHIEKYQEADLFMLGVPANF